ncbi:BOS complex subunit NOMO1 [Achroia grisella]|uniref:BOS complex subunit NOMO1 n=1 Tax=Achroia grisella TaxID=688607 RepID=UPI0027D27E28|nr:BOS complex subunit NOMO1 [Achroia grisella]
MILHFKLKKCVLLAAILIFNAQCYANDILGCGGFVKSHVSLDFSKIDIGLYTKTGSLKEKTECAPTNGYYFLPLYEKGEYVLKVHPPPGWSFEPSQVELHIDGETDQCSTGQDINFSFNGFGIAGKVITSGQKQGPSDVSVALVNDKGDVRTTVTSAGGDFHFTPVIPGRYTIKASHPRWKLDPAQATVQVKEGNTALPLGVLAVKGYDVKGTITSFDSPISGLYVLLYSKEANPKFRVEGCNTALLQGVPDSPICHTITDTSGEFTFGLVPAGDYELLVLKTPPGQVAVTYNVKPDKVPFSVLHDSIFIKNAFEVTGFTMVGTALSSAGGAGLKGVRVLVDGRPVGTTDAAGKFTLTNLQPATYKLGFQHEQCEFEESQVVVRSTGPARAAGGVARRWRVCGRVPPPHARPALLTPTTPATPTTLATVAATPGEDGTWCTFLPPGTYSAKVDVSEQEQRDGLQFYPLTQIVSVGNGPVDGIIFSQLKGRLTGKVVCKVAADCESLQVTLRALSVDGSYVGKPLTTVAKGGSYEFSEVLPGSVEVSVSAESLCWREERHLVVVAHEHAPAPDFEHVGYVLRLHADHPIEVEYSGENGVQGVFTAARGPTTHCVPAAGRYTLRPRGCHRYTPPARTGAAGGAGGARRPEEVRFVASAHAATVRVVAPVAAADVTLEVTCGGRALPSAPLQPRPHASGGYIYEHTLYLQEGETCSVWAKSSSLVAEASGPQQVTGRGDCQPAALTLRAHRAVTLAGTLRPPVAGAAVTLGADDLKLVQITTEDGTYKFGPLDASKKYTIVAEKESYVFSAPTGPDDNSVITAHKLADIIIDLRDEDNDTPLQGALVSVSGGNYRRNTQSGADGRLRFPALQPAQYYVKPHMKEYRFSPPHQIVVVEDGQDHRLTLKASRVAWSCAGRLVSAAGAAWPGAVLRARPHAARCQPEDATTDGGGGFRIRGLLPGCMYTIELKESSNPELAGLKLAKAPPTIEIKGKKDIEDVVVIAHQRQQVTDASVVVYAAVEHYRSLRVRLAGPAGGAGGAGGAGPGGPELRLDAAGLAAHRNRGLLVALPRLPADNATYSLHLHSTLSKATHSYQDQVRHFVSDGRFKHFYLEFQPEVKATSQEVRQSWVVAVPLLVALVVALARRGSLLQLATSLTARCTKNPRSEQTDQPLVPPTTRRATKKKFI